MVVVVCIFYNLVFRGKMWTCGSTKAARMDKTLLVKHFERIICYSEPQPTSMLYPFGPIPASGLSTPCIGLHTPLTPSFSLLTTLPPFIRLFFAALPSRSSSAFCRICSFVRFRTQIALVTVFAEEERDGREKVEGELGDGAM